MANGIGNFIASAASTAFESATQRGDVLLRAGSSFSGVIPDVVVRELYRDDLAITGHPVEQGSTISDHAFLLPVGLEMEAGFSNASAGDPNYIDRVYEELRQIQGIRQPFEIFTPRRMYQSMLLQGLNVTRDVNAGNCSLLCALVFRQVIIAATQTTNAPTTTSPNPDPAQQKHPESTAGVTERGTVTPVPVGPQAFAGSFSPGYAPGITGTTPDLGSGLNLPSLDASAFDGTFTSPPNLPEVAPNAGNLNPGGGNIGGVTPYNPFTI